MMRSSRWCPWIVPAVVLLGCGVRTLPYDATEAGSGGNSTDATGGTSASSTASGGTVTSSSTKFTCEPGTYFCVCYGNQTCNAGLMCASGYCVDESPSASGGARSTTRVTASGASSATTPSGRAGNSTVPAGGRTNVGGQGGATARAGSMNAGAQAIVLGGTSGNSGSDGTGGTWQLGDGGTAGHANDAQCPEQARRLGCCGYPGFSGAAGAAGAAGASGPIVPPCRTELEETRNGLCAAKLISVGTPGAQLQIDVTEVTRAQYQEWLGTEPEPTLQESPLCAGNASFVPHVDCMSGPDVCQGGGCGNHPQVCVDWCDARAYCRAVGKRLCGNLGGGQNPTLSADDATQSQWYFACSSGGLNAYPYGTIYSNDACNTADGVVPRTVEAVANRFGCQSTCAFSGVFDLSGNVHEWEDSCYYLDDMPDYCLVRGGASVTADGTSACAHASGLGIPAWFDSSVGFRCCGP